MSLPMDPHMALITDLTRRIDALRSATYEGRDKEGLAIVTVDGDGIVAKIHLAQTIARHHPEVVAEAIRAAVDAAQQRLTQAFTQLAAQAQKFEQEWQTQQ